MKYLFSILLLMAAMELDAQAASSTTLEHRGSDAPDSQMQDGTLVTAQSHSTDVWFHRIELELSGDHNNNGFYHQLYLKFDADTNRSRQAVWAEFSLQRPGQAEQIFHVSSIFTLHRQSRQDWFAIETVLEDNYPTDYYDLTIRLFDANDGWLLAEVSAWDEPIMADLPLEDYRRDQQVITVIESYGGSFGILSLSGLCLVLYRLQQRRCQLSTT